MDKSRDTETRRKQQDIYKAFMILFKSKNDPNAFRPKLYEEVAEKFYVKPDYVRKVVNGGGEIKTKK